MMHVWVFVFDPQLGSLQCQMYHLVDLLFYIDLLFYMRLRTLLSSMVWLDGFGVIFQPVSADRRNVWATPLLHLELYLDLFIGMHQVGSNLSQSVQHKV